MSRSRLLVVAVLVAAMFPFSPAFADPPASTYSLAATVSPAPLTPADCAADSRCAIAPSPSGDDDEPGLRQAVLQAAARAVPGQPGTVLLAAGTYRLGAPLQVPPNVNLRGAGITATTVQLIPENWANFGYSHLIRPDGTTSAGSTNTVSDLTVNGSCKKGAGAPDSAVLPSSTCDLGASRNYAGGVKAGDRWTIQQVRFTNLNYFKLWIHGTSGVRVIDCRWDNWGGAGSGDEDNIGGGGGATDTVIENNQWDKTIRGNSIDLTHATGVTIRNNTVETDKFFLTYWTPAQPGYGTIYMEAVTDATIENNTLTGGGITLRSNANYQHTDENVNVTNPRAITVRGNRLLDSFAAGVIVNYDDYTDVPGGHVMYPGGANVITGNTITRPARGGIIVFVPWANAKSSPDTISGNTVLNAGSNGAFTGYDKFDMVGVGLAGGSGDTVTDNTIVDDQTVPTTWYGVQLGLRGTTAPPTGTVLSGNTAVGVIGGLNRWGAGAPDPATALTASGGTLRWAEAYPLANRLIGGYRVYRDGHLAATIPVGSATIPANLLTDAQSSFETGVDPNWTAAYNATAAWQTGAGAVGDKSFALTAVSAAQMAAYGPVVPATAGRVYTSVASFRSLGSGSRIRAGIAWVNASGGIIDRWASGNSATVDSSTAWTTSYYTATAPAGTVAMRAFPIVDAPVAGQTHLVDRVGLVEGTVTETWTDPSPGSTYHVVAYRIGDGENSAPTKVVMS